MEGWRDGGESEWEGRRVVAGGKQSSRKRAGGRVATRERRGARARVTGGEEQGRVGGMVGERGKARGERVEGRACCIAGGWAVELKESGREGGREGARSERERGRGQGGRGARKGWRREWWESEWKGRRVVAREGAVEAGRGDGAYVGSGWGGAIQLPPTSVLQPYDIKHSSVYRRPVCS